MKTTGTKYNLFSLNHGLIARNTRTPMKIDIVQQY